jgi:hypothetical protein
MAIRPYGGAAEQRPYAIGVREFANSINLFIDSPAPAPLATPGCAYSASVSHSPSARSSADSAAA